MTLVSPRYQNPYAGFPLDNSSQGRMMRPSLPGLPVGLRPPVAPVASPASLYTFLPNRQNAPYRFAVMGDAGTGDLNQALVARQMSFWHQVMPYNSVMVLGDNVYKNGEPALFPDRITRPYQDLQRQGVRFFPVLGNHDVKKGFGDWQLAYWGVPPFYNFKLGPPGFEVEFWAIDTNLLIPQSSLEGQANPVLARQKAACQMAWLAQSLAQSTASMKVVYGHHPMASRGANTKPGRAFEQQILASQLGPLFSRYGVDLYMSGHEHHYEKPALVSGTYHLVSGAGGKLDSAKRGGPEGNGLLKQLHFMLFEITPQGLTYRTISSDGKFIDCGKIPRRGMLGGQLYTYA